MTDSQKIDQHILNKYKIIKKLGSGAYGHVWKVATHDKPNEFFALKKVFEAFQHDTDAQRTYREISILKKMDHSNIIKLYEVLPSTSGRDIYLVFQYMTTDLYRAIYQSNLQEIHKKFIIYQLLKGLYYLHSANVLHRDLKPSNLLLSTQCQLKICDFGLARHLDSTVNQENVLTEGVATRWYRAPEVLLGSNQYNHKADMWSVGCILAEMVLKSPIFNSNSTVSQFQRILQVVGRPNSEELDQLGSELASSLIRQFGTIRQKSTKQIFGHVDNEFVLDLVYKLLRLSPLKRITAKEAMMHPYLKQFFKEEDLIIHKNQILLETDQNVKLSTDEYRDLITKYFIAVKSPKQTQRFSDLKREKSFGKIIEQINTRKSSGEKDQVKKERKNTHLFEQLLKQRQISASKGSRVGSSGSHFQQRNKQNLNVNRDQVLQKFSQINSKPAKRAGTFAALKKVTGSKFNR